ncbi:hypothetical protein D9758_005607 [Tetrapyrgos nigripes]|uniref:DUF6534 domain-containing protein n=1 Tax=Tetrapyrgos nigripes TaxID=182062 RepID=A0A8H5LPI6_9AGAR|nr:hypothetical protein D9758_005607 [Tetrapyrgos nigripes]
MIYDKRPPEAFENAPQDAPQDAPPSYDTLSTSEATQNLQSDVKRPLDIPAPDLSSPSSSTTTPTSPNSFGSTYKGKSKASSSSSANSNSSWWGYFGMSSNSRQVRTTVLGIIKDLVRGHQNSDYAAAKSILESCAEACAGYSLSLSELLQEKSVEEHTPLYWAIVNRPPEEEHDMDGTPGPDLLTCLLTFSTPLHPPALSDVRLACLLTSDQDLFKRLRMTPEFAPLSGTDQMVLGAGTVPDDVVVENLKGDEGAFAANLSINQFQKRMRISKEVAVEFIARGRMWRLAFKVSQNTRLHSHQPRMGLWCISLSLMENSPPTPVDSRLIIHDAISSNSSTSLLDSPASPSLAASLSSSSRAQKPLSIRIKSGQQDLIPPELFRRRDQLREILVPLDDAGAKAASLEHAGNSYIGADDTLRARLEARLTKGNDDHDCVEANITTCINYLQVKKLESRHSQRCSKAMGANDNDLGAFLVGVVLGAFFLGVACVQSHAYFTTYNKDPWFIKAVTICLASNIAHQIGITHKMWINTVTHYGDKTILAEIGWGLTGHVYFNAFTAVTVQAFYFYRIYVLLGHQYWYIPAVLSLASLSQFIMALIYAVKTTTLSSDQLPTLTNLVSGVNGVSAGLDFVISAIMIYIFSNKRTGFRRTDTLLYKLIAYVISSGLLTTICALGTFIAFKVSPTTFIAYPFNFLIGRMYIVALLASLNSRASLRNAGRDATEDYNNVSLSHQWNRGAGSDTIGMNDSRTPARVLVSIERQEDSYQTPLDNKQQFGSANNGEEIKNK